MKLSKFAKICCLTLVVILALPAAVAETISLAYRDGALNLRTGPGTQYLSAGYLHHGDAVTVLSAGDVWSQIQTSDGKTGYVKNLYIAGGADSSADGTEYVSESYSASVTTAVNFRSGASGSTKSMGVLYKGTKVTVLGKNGNWLLVKTAAGTQGYVYAAYVTTSSVPAAATKTVSASWVNVRKGGGMHYGVVTVLPKGTVVSVLATGNYWTKVSYKNYTGWIKSCYLK